MVAQTALDERMRAQCSGLFAVYGLTVADAIKFTLDHYRRQAASAPVDQVIRQLLESKKAAGEPSHTSIC